MTNFIEVVTSSATGRLAGSWVDDSDDQAFIFHTPNSRVRLARRLAYPATFAQVHGDTLVCGYGSPEAAHKLLTAPLATIDEAFFRVEESLYMAINGRTGALTVQTDAFNAVPLFVGTQAERCVVSDDFATTYQLLDPSKCQLDLQCVAEFLTGKVIFDRTFVKQIRLLYDRKRLSWSNGQTRLQLPPDSSATDNYKQRTATGRDFPQRFEQTLERYWQRFVGTGGTLACDLSLGLDSTTIAAALSVARHTPVALTALFPGEFAASQQAKLTEFLQHFDATSVTLPATEDLDYPWLAVLRGQQSHPFYHYAFPYTDTFDRLYAAAAERGATAVFTGIGGDELFYNTNPRKAMDDDYPFDEKLPLLGLQPAAEYLKKHRQPAIKLPVPLMQPTALTMGQRLSGKYLNHGLWLVRPYADPDLYSYMQTMPLQYCMDKLLLRIYADARGVPRSISAPDVNENFEAVYLDSVWRLRQPIEYMLNNSMLATHKLVDIAILRDNYRHFVEHDRHNLDTALFYQRLLTAELNLRSLYL